ncbi:MAG: hypothetical protein AAGH99_12235 [Planctomycetota bacterium]
MQWKVFMDQDPRLQSVFGRVGRKPAWPMLAALACGALVVVVPVVLALLAGLVVGAVVFTLGSAVAKVGECFGGLGGSSKTTEATPPGDDLRENVRVIQRP